MCKLSRFVFGSLVLSRALYDKVLCANSDKILGIMSSPRLNHPFAHDNEMQGIPTVGETSRL